jgi:hypothetical protein
MQTCFSSDVIWPQVTYARWYVLPVVSLIVIASSYRPAAGPSWMKTESSPARSVVDPCHREERSDVATSMTERTFMGVATSLRSAR